MSLVSIIIPAYNAERWIADAIGSVLAQTHADLEVIVVDDGSTDRTASIARSFTDPRVHVLAQTNAGVSAARNAGLDQARGEVIGFLDADDAMLPSNISSKLEKLWRSGADWVYGDLLICDEQLRPTGVVLVAADRDLPGIILGMTGISVPTPCSNLLAKRHCFENGIRCDPALSTSADQDLALQLAKHHTYAHLPEALNLYRQVPGSMSRNIALYAKDHLHLFRKAAAAGWMRPWSYRRRCMATVLRSIAGSWWKDGASPRRAFPYLVRAVLMWPPILFRRPAATSR